MLNGQTGGSDGALHRNDRCGAGAEKVGLKVLGCGVLRQTSIWVTAQRRSGNRCNAVCLQGNKRQGHFEDEGGLSKVKMLVEHY